VFVHTLFSVLGFGLDSFLAGLAIGPFLKSWRERFGLALAFGAFDIAATFAGSAWPHGLVELNALPLYLLCAFLLAATVRRTGLVYWLPLALSLDNFFGGARTDTALAAGVGSALLALIGLSVTGVYRSKFLALRQGA
jgi:hypothetical protein